MAFFSLGPAEMLLLLLFSSGGSMPDAVSIFPAEDYFKMRGVETTQEKMFELAMAEPRTPRAQVMQLQALRMLDAMNLDGANLKKVHEIAAGKVGRDPTGFAQKYANRILQRAEGAPEPPVVKAKASEALEWFPANSMLTGSIDFRLARIPGVRAGPGVPNLWKILPEKIKREILEKAFEIIEQTGNVEIYRGSVAMVMPENKEASPSIYVRFSGNFNQEWLIQTLKGAGMKFDERKGPGGETYQHAKWDFFSFAFLDNKEILVADLAFHPRMGDGPDMIEEMLQIKAGKKDSVLKGKRLKDMLDKVPPGAIGLFAAEVPEQGILEFLLGRDVSVPRKVVFFATPALKALDIQAEGVMANEEAARNLVKILSEGRQQAIKEVKEFGNRGGPEFPVDAVIQLLESVQVEAKGNSAHLRLLLPEGVVRAIVDSMLRLGQRAIQEEKK